MRSRIGPSLERAKSGCAHVLFWAWPWSWGHEHLMDMLNPSPPAGLVTRTLRGFPLRLTFDSGSYVGRFLYYRRMYEEGTIQFLRRVLVPGMSFLDVGANLGLHTTVAASLVGPSGRVIAVEPQADLCDLVRLNVTQNGLSNVSVIHAALGRQNGTAELHHVHAGNPAAAALRLQLGEQSLSSSPVPLRTLADVLGEAGLESSDLVVKIDVEGAELEVLEGAADCFDLRPPSIMFVECNDHHLRRFGASSLDLLGKLAALGYRVSSLRRGRRFDHAPSAPVNADVIAWRPERCPW